MNNKQMQFLGSVNQDLQEMVEAAAKDYVAVNALLKQYYSRRTSTVTDIKAEEMMGNLQYMDIFSQRVEHLVSTHQKMLNDNLAENFKESFFHLHVFQALTIEQDLLQSIDSIKTALHEVKDQFIKPGQTQWQEDALFGNMVFIKIILQKTIDELLRAGGVQERLPIPPLTTKQIQTLHSLYTMESERLVLTWFLNSMPSGTWEELMKCYEVELTQVGIDKTELF